jgi:predicted small lipoprotein YifL
MRSALALTALAALAACGQTGSLYLPDESVETPVEIRGPAPAQPPAPAPEAEEDEEKEDKTGEPPAR